MARPLRIDVEDGWYHVTSRGIERRAIFHGKRYYCHFVELLEKMSMRYDVQVHAFCLMQTHCHLIIRTPNANASRAIQWLNGSYSTWFNVKQDRVGHVFQGRFGSTLIDDNGAWLLVAADYVHLNPIGITALGLGKSDKKAESRGYKAPTDEMVRRRLAKLRKHPWSSYGAYTGYTGKPKWLHTKEILARSGGRKRYRQDLHKCVTRGADPERFECMLGRVAIGSTAFIEQAKKLVGHISKEQPARSFVTTLIDLDTIIAAVEKEKGEKWDAFRNRHGDTGRDLVLYLARERSGLTLREIGEQLGEIEYKTVGKAVQRFAQRLQKDRRLQAQVRRCLKQMSLVEM